MHLEHLAPVLGMPPRPAALDGEVVVLVVKGGVLDGGSGMEMSAGEHALRGGARDARRASRCARGAFGGARPPRGLHRRHQRRTGGSAAGACGCGRGDPAQARGRALANHRGVAGTRPHLPSVVDNALAKKLSTIKRYAFQKTQSQDKQTSAQNDTRLGNKLV